MDNSRIKNTKHNHSRNLEIVLNEFKLTRKGAGIQLEDLALKCGVSIRQIYRYLNELQNLGYEIAKTSDPNSNNSCRRYVLLETEPLQNINLNFMNMLSNLEKLRLEIKSAQSFVMELFIRHWMIKSGLVLPLTMPLYSFGNEDSVTVNHQMVVCRSNSEDQWEDIKIKVSPKVVNQVIKSLSGEISSQQRLRDGWFSINLRTKRSKQYTGILTQWGSHVEVIEPGWLKYKMLENCKSILYANRLKKADKNNVFLSGGHLVNN